MAIPAKLNFMLIYVNKTVLHFKTFVAIPELEGKVNLLLSHLFELLTGVTFTVFHQVIIMLLFTDLLVHFINQLIANPLSIPSLLAWTPIAAPPRETQRGPPGPP